MGQLGLTRPGADVGERPKHDHRTHDRRGRPADAGTSRRVACQTARIAGSFSRRTDARRSPSARPPDGAHFEDPEWVERWDVVFADLYLDAHDADVEGRVADVPRPWRLAFDADPGLPPLRHVLLGINAHVNYDLPQALLAVIDDEDFADEVAARSATARPRAH